MKVLICFAFVVACAVADDGKYICFNQSASYDTKNLKTVMDGCNYKKGETLTAEFYACVLKEYGLNSKSVEDFLKAVTNENARNTVLNAVKECLDKPDGEKAACFTEALPKVCKDNMPDA